MAEDDRDFRKGRESTGAGSEEYRTFRDYLAAKRATRVRYPYAIRGPLSGSNRDATAAEHSRVAVEASEGPPGTIERD